MVTRDSIAELKLAILILMFKVHLGCWNSTQSILAWLQAEGKGDKEEDFMYLWHHFLTRWN